MTIKKKRLHLLERGIFLSPPKRDSCVNRPLRVERRLQSKHEDHSSDGRVWPPRFSLILLPVKKKSK